MQNETKRQWHLVNTKLELLRDRIYGLQARIRDNSISPHDALEEGEMLKDRLADALNSIAVLEASQQISASQIITEARESICFQATPLTSDQATAGNVLFDAIQYLRGIRPTGLFAQKLFIDKQ